jgi:hypothetical protein
MTNAATADLIGRLAARLHTAWAGSDPASFKAGFHRLGHFRRAEVNQILSPGIAVSVALEMLDQGNLVCVTKS